MDRWLAKLSRIMPTFICIQVGTITSLLLLRWISTEYGILELKKEVREWWLLGLPGIPIIIWLRPRVAGLLQNNKWDVPKLFQYVAFVSIAITSVLSQIYFSEAIGSMIVVDSIADIDGQSLSRFYTIRNFEVHDEQVAVSDEVIKNGRKRNYLRTYYIVAPLTDRGAEVVTTDTWVVWLGLTYKYVTDIRLASNDPSYESNKAESLGKFRNASMRMPNYFERTLNSSDRDGFQKSIEIISPNLKSKSVVLEPVYHPYEERGGKKLKWIIWSILLGNAFLAMILYFSPYRESEIQ